MTGELTKRITDGNYKEKSLAYLAAHDGRGFLIALAEGTLRGVEYHQSLEQWGAWLAFFRRNGIKQSFMLQSEVYMVPAEWPHLFTSDSTVLQDHDAGDRFAVRWRAALARWAAKEWQPNGEWKPETMAEAASYTDHRRQS